MCSSCSVVHHETTQCGIFQLYCTISINLSPLHDCDMSDEIFFSSLHLEARLLPSRQGKLKNYYVESESLSLWWIRYHKLSYLILFVIVDPEPYILLIFSSDWRKMMWRYVHVWSIHLNLFQIFTKFALICCWHCVCAIALKCLLQLHASCMYVSI